MLRHPWSHKESSTWKTLQKPILSSLPTHMQKPQTQTNPQKQRGLMHNDQLKDYNKFPDCLPLVVSSVDFDCNGLPVLFSLQQVAWSGLCFNHSVIELVRQWRIFRGSFSVWKGEKAVLVWSIYHFTTLTFLICLSSVFLLLVVCIDT